VRLGTVALLLLAGIARGQDPAKLLAEKLKRPFVANVPWIQDFDEARRLSREQNKPIFAYFTRSFAADPGSDQVEGGVLASKEFKEFVAGFVPFLHVTTLIEGRKDDNLLLRMGKKSWPTVLVLDEYGGVLADHRSAPTVEAFRETAAPALRRFALRKRALEGDRDAVYAYAVERAGRGQLTSPQFRREMERVAPLSEKEQKDAKALLTELLLGEAELYAQAEWFARMEKEGLVPTDLEGKLNFYVPLLGLAEYRENPAEMERILGILKELLKDQPGTEGVFDKAEEKLADLKARLAAEGER